MEFAPRRATSWARSAKNARMTLAICVLYVQGEVPGTLPERERHTLCAYERVGFEASPTDPLSTFGIAREPRRSILSSHPEGWRPRNLRADGAL